jgi:hypothetical protein
MSRFLDPSSAKALVILDITEGLEYFRGYYQSLCPTQMGRRLCHDLVSNCNYIGMVIFTAYAFVKYLKIKKPLAKTCKLWRYHFRFSMQCQ